MKAPALDPLAERLTVERLGTALILRPLVEGPLVLTAGDLARLSDVLGPDPEIPDTAKTLRCHLRADIGEVAKTDACGSRRPTRAQSATSRPVGPATGEHRMRPTPPPRTVKLSPSDLKKISLAVARKVLAQPAIAGYLDGLAAWGGSPEEVAAAVVRKLSAPAKPAAKTTARPAAKAQKSTAIARVRKLQKELAAQPNPVLQTEIRRRLSFAELEARGGAR